MKNRLRGLCAMACCMLPWAISYGATLAAQGKDRNALWKQIHNVCTTKAENHVFPPSPCIEVETGPDGYAVFKDRHGHYQYLLLPLARISGIESPALLQPDAPNYFADAWTARIYVEAALHETQPRDVISLAVNSPQSRSQDQLHIHIDCIRSDVRNVVRQLLPVITNHWHWLPEGLPPNDHLYEARWQSGIALTINPFKDLAKTLAHGDALANHSIAVLAATSPLGEPGFVLLSGRVDRSKEDRASAEELQDVGCAIARQTRQP